MTATDRVREIVAPLVAEADLDLYDLELEGGVLKVLVDAPGGADINVISKLSRAISRSLDEHDPIDGKYTLEVGSPGLERPLREPSHYATAVGTTVKVKTKPGVDGERRVEGTVTAADDTSVTVESPDGTQRTLRYEDIERARTTFEWGGAPKKNQERTRS